MSSLTILSEGNSVEQKKRSYALIATINGNNINLPMISPYPSEIKRAENRGLKINSPSVTFLEHVTSPKDFINRAVTSKCNYEKFARDHSNHLINYSFDLHPKQEMSREIRDEIREIQIDANSQFLFEYEIDINQSVTTVTQQMDQAQKWLSIKKPNKILVPVIDMKIEDEDLFLKKLEELSKKFKRINIIYQSPTQAPVQWAYLQKFLKNNIVWCHMDCVLKRYNSDKISHRVSLYTLGISSSSSTYGFGGGNSGKKSEPKIYQFDRKTIQYHGLDKPHLPSVAERKDRIWIDSLNEEIKQLQIMREHSKKGTLYTEYIPTKLGLQMYLRNF